LRLVLFLVRMWRRNARLRLIPPPPSARKRLAAPLLVYIFGMTSTPSRVMTGGGLGGARLHYHGITCFPRRLAPACNYRAL